MSEKQHVNPPWAEPVCDSAAFQPPVGAPVHRIPAWWGWQGPLWVTQPNPLPKQGHPEQASQHRVQVGLEYLQRRRFHSLPGQLFRNQAGLSSHRVGADKGKKCVCWTKIKQVILFLKGHLKLKDALLLQVSEVFWELINVSVANKL